MKTTGQHLWRALTTHVVGTVEAGGLAGIATFAGAAWIGVALPALHVENAFGAERDQTAGIALEAALLGIRSTPAAGAPLEARKQMPFLLDPTASRIVGLATKPLLPDDSSPADGPTVVQVDPAVSTPAPEPPAAPAPAPAPTATPPPPSEPTPASPPPPEAPPAPPSDPAPPATQKPSGDDTTPPSSDSASGATAPPGWGTPAGTLQLDTSDGSIVGGTSEDSSDSDTMSDPANSGADAGTGSGYSGGNGNGNGNAGGNANAGGNNPNAGGANAGGNGNGKGH